MKELLRSRRSQFLLETVGYLRYVLTDHFLLVLMVLLGYAALQYRELMLHFPKNPWLVVLVMVFWTVLLFPLGRPATYLQAADQVFVLPKEEEIVDWIKGQTRRTTLLWGSMQLMGQVLVLPIYLRLGLPLWVFLVGLALLTLGKVAYHQHQWHAWIDGDRLLWAPAIQAEVKRQQSILQFFALFTHVKGLTSSVKRRSYLEGLLKWLSRGANNVWVYLYSRAFLRSGDYWALTLRLTFLALICLLMVPQPLIAIGLTALFDYLLWFQLFTLHAVYEYQYMARLYPHLPGQKASGLQTVFRRIFSVIVGGELLFGLARWGLSWGLLALLGFVLVLNEGLLPRKMAKSIDEPI